MDLFIPANETERLRALHGHSILDTEPEDRFDKIIQHTASIFDVPIALFTLIDANRQWFKSKVGLEVDEMARANSFCAHAVGINESLVVENTVNDVFFADSELVQKPPYIKFYAGVPIRDDGKMPLGTLCIIDTNPRSFSWEEFRQLETLGKQVEHEMQKRKASLKLN